MKNCLSCPAPFRKFVKRISKNPVNIAQCDRLTDFVRDNQISGLLTSRCPVDKCPSLTRGKYQERFWPRLCCGPGYDKDRADLSEGINMKCIL